MLVGEAGLTFSAHMQPVGPGQQVALTERKSVCVEAFTGLASEPRWELGDLGVQLQLHLSADVAARARRQQLHPAAVSESEAWGGAGGRLPTRDLF